MAEKAKASEAVAEKASEAGPGAPKVASAAGPGEAAAQKNGNKEDV